MSRFNGKIALVTGAGSGIGRAIAQRLARDGARVIAADVSGQQEAVAAQIGGGALARQLDVSKEDEVLALERWIRDEFGGLDLLANNAGLGGAQAPLHEYPMQAFDQLMAVNVRGAYMVLQAGLRLMLTRGGGSVVNTASVTGFRASPLSSAYVMTKGAIVMMTRAAALEYAGQNIRVNAIGPGVTRTPILDGAPADYLQMLADQVPQGRLGQPEDCANVAAFLLDEQETAHVTGQVWLLDGGRTAG